MLIKYLFAFGLCLFSVIAYSQSSGIDEVLRLVEQNNEELKSYASRIKSRELELKAENNLPDPNVGFYYLPWGNHTSGDYNEIQVTQSFEFPTVYSIRRKHIDKEKEQLATEYTASRQEILLTAKKYCQELVHLNKRLSIERSRLEMSKTVLDHHQQMFDHEQVGILDLNKAKVAWMQDQFRVDEVETDRLNLLILLKNLNGGNDIDFDLANYQDNTQLPLQDSLWQDKMRTDPELQSLLLKEEISHHQIKFYQSKGLPNLTAGFNRQGVEGEFFSGIYGGISIPLWNNRNKVKAARSRYAYQQSFTTVRVMAISSAFEKQYNEYQLMKAKYEEYSNTMAGLNSDILLLQAYELGEISYLEYYMELLFFRRAQDTLLELEKELFQKKSELLRHQL